MTGNYNSNNNYNTNNYSSSKVDYNNMMGFDPHQSRKDRQIQYKNQLDSQVLEKYDNLTTNKLIAKNRNVSSNPCKLVYIYIYYRC